MVFHLNVKTKAAIVLALVLGVTAVFHLVLAMSQKRVSLSGDEHVYFRVTKINAETGEKSLLPGTLEFTHRTRFNCRVFSYFFSRDTGSDIDTEKASLVRNVALFHTVAFIVVLFCMYIQGRCLGFSRMVSIIPPALMALFPWFGFYIHTLWPEIIHALLLSSSFTLIFLYFQKMRLLYLIPAGLLLGYSLLTKGVLNQFLFVLVLFVIVVGITNKSNGDWKKRILTGLTAGAALLLPILLVVLPQLIVNNANGHGYRFSDNKWRNIEFGMRGEVPGDPEESGKLTYRAMRKVYESEPLVIREAKAKERTVEFLRSESLGYVLGRQVEKYWWLFTEGVPIFERSINDNRWPENSTRWFEHLISPSRVMFYGLVLLAILGAFANGIKGPNWMLLCLFACYYSAALFVLSFNMRFAMQLMPTLCLLSVGCGASIVNTIGKAPWRKQPANR